MNTSNNPIISVAVTAYKRPKYTEDAIKSFLNQDFNDAEMLILDDCVEDSSVKEIVERYAARDSRVRLIKNEQRLGYCKNFLKSLTEAKGKFIVTLGDDDILLDKNALATYVHVFQEHPDVSYIYSNMVQINENLEIDYIFELFDKDYYCKNLNESLTKTWLRSCFIAGIGLRNNVDFEKLYPKDDILFPQVELIGKILGNSSSYAISSRLIGARAHLAQLGNVALKGKNIKGTERHSVYELNMVFDRVQDYFKQNLDIKDQIDRSFINSFFETNHKAIFANEKISNGNVQILKTFMQAIKNNPMALVNINFTGYFLAAFLLPKKLLFKIKEKYKKNSLQQYGDLLVTYNKMIQEIKNV